MLSTMRPKLRKLLPLLALLLPGLLLSCSGPSIAFEELVLNEHQFVVRTTGKPYTGSVRSFYADGMPKVKGYMIDGYQDDKWLFWYEEGQLQESTYFKNGERQGLLTAWAWCGNKLFEVCYKKNLQHGPTIRYLNGAPITLEHFRMGVLHGPYLKWFDNGQESIAGTYHNGQKCGTWHTYIKTGELLSTEQF